MQPILRDIRAVAGVTGVAIIVKADGHIERLFPAAFTEEHTKELLKLVIMAYQRLRGFERLSLRFERVVVHLFNQADYLLFATVLPDVEEAVFETVVKSKFAAIGRSLVRRSAPRTAVVARPPSGTSASARPAPVISVLLDVFNGVTQTVGPMMGLTRVANCWRQARDSTATHNEAVSAIEIDPAGRLSIRKGRLVAPTADNIQDIVAMLIRFFHSIGTAAPNAEEALYALAEPNRSLLEHHGFFHFLDAALDRKDGSRRASRPALR